MNSKMMQQGFGSWGEAFRIYIRPRVVAMLFLGFSAGLPLLLVFSTLSAWLRDYDISKSTIGFFSWVGLTYSIKFLWAPVIDRLQIPGLTQWLGKRRSWMLFAQLSIALGLCVLAFMGPNDNLGLFALVCVFVAFGSATQDVALDAYRIEAVVPEWQGAMSAMYVLGYRLAMLVAGAGALYIAEFQTWTIAYFVMAGLMGVGVVTVLLVSEPEAKEKGVNTHALEQRVVDYLAGSEGSHQRVRDIKAWFIGAVVCPFVDFFERNGKMALYILLFIGLYRISDITMGVMANPFYLDLGYSKADIASIGKVFGFVMTIVGSALGGLLVVRFGIMRPLLLGAVMVAVTNLLFAWMASVDVVQSGLLTQVTNGLNTIYAGFGGAGGFSNAQTMLAMVISADNLSGGLAVAAFIAYLSGLTNTAYTATQYALFSSLMTLPAKFLGGFSGVVVDAHGYAEFFVYASVLGLPAILMVWFLMRRQIEGLQHS